MRNTAIQPGRMRASAFSRLQLHYTSLGSTSQSLFFVGIALMDRPRGSPVFQASICQPSAARQSWNSRCTVAV